MIVRIRTNLGASRLDVSPTCTIEELKKKIIEKLNIIVCDDIIVAFDLPGERLIEGSTIESIGLKNGDEIFVLGKFSEIVVEKSYVNEKHELVQAGKKLKLTEPPAGKKAAPIAEPAPIAAPVPKMAEEHRQEELPPQMPAMPAASSCPTSDFDPALYRFEDDIEDGISGIRAPDQVQNMRLVDDPMALVMDRLTAEDQAQLELYHTQLIETGLDDYEIQTYMVEYRNDLLAQRMIAGEEEGNVPQDFQDLQELLRQGGIPPVSSLEELEALLRNANIGQHARQNLNNVYGSAPTRKQRREMERKTKKEEKKTGKGGIISGAEEDAAIIRTLQQQQLVHQQQTSQSRRLLQQTGQSILQPMTRIQSSSSAASTTAPLRSQSATVSSTNAATATTTRRMIIDEDEEEEEEEDDDDDDLEALLAFLTSTNTNNNNTNNNNKSNKQKKQKKKPTTKPTSKSSSSSVAAKGKESESHSQEAKQAYVTSGRQDNVFGLLDSDSDDSESNSSNVENDTNNKNKEAEEEALDYAIALSMQETQEEVEEAAPIAAVIAADRPVFRDLTHDITDPRIATSTNAVNNNNISEEDRVLLMRNFLEHNEPLPDWLASEITDSTNEDLLQYAATQQQVQQQQLSVAEASVVEYDEEDEMLALAIEASLNEL